MSYLIEWMQKPKIVLKIFPTYRDLRSWLQNNHSALINFGAEIRITTSTIIFPNGARLYLGHAETEEDMDKFRGLEYDVVLGGDEHLRIRALMNRL